MGVCPAVVSVTPDNALMFRFDGSKYFSAQTKDASSGIRTEDGGLLYVGEDGCVGLLEVTRSVLKLLKLAPEPEQYSPPTVKLQNFQPPCFIKIHLNYY